MNNNSKSGKGVKIGLVVVSILLIISLIANMYFYSKQYGVTPDSGLENRVSELESQVVGLQSQRDSLTTEKTNLQTQVANLESQVDSLTNERNTLSNQLENVKAAKLVTRLGSSDERPWLSDDYLHVYGSVINVGSYAATNSKLHVVLYQGQTVAKDTFIELGTISGESYTDIDQKIFYDGSALTSWSIVPECD